MKKDPCLSILSLLLYATYSEYVSTMDEMRLEQQYSAEKLKISQWNKKLEDFSSFQRFQ